MGDRFRDVRDHLPDDLIYALWPVRATIAAVDWKGRHVFITGGTSGIGRATVLRLARQGALVTFVGRDEVRGRKVVDSARAHRGEVRFVPRDLTEPGAAEDAVRQAEEQAPIDAAVNAAASLSGPPRPLAAFSDEQFEASVVRGVHLDFACLRAEINAAQARSAPLSIVNVSSINGLGAAPQAPLYSAMKAAMLAFTKSCALDYAAGGIRVNAVVAGAFDTPMLRSAYDQVAGGDAGLAEKMLQQFLGMVPLRRLGTADEAAGAIEWLCSDDSAFVTGASIIVDGGLTSFCR